MKAVNESQAQEKGDPKTDTHSCVGDFIPQTRCSGGLLPREKPLRALVSDGTGVGHDFSAALPRSGHAADLSPADDNKAVRNHAGRSRPDLKVPVQEEMFRHASNV